MNAARVLPYRSSRSSERRLRRQHRRSAATPPAPVRRLIPTALAALLFLSGCATPNHPAKPAAPDDLLISAGASQVDPAAARASRTDTPPAAPPRDLGPLRVSVKVGGRDVDPADANRAAA